MHYTQNILSYTYIIYTIFTQPLLNLVVCCVIYKYKYIYVQYTEIKLKITYSISLIYDYQLYIFLHQN